MTRHRLPALRLLLAVWCFAVVIRAQEPKAQQIPAGPTYAIKSQLVQVFLTVMEGTRRVTDLRMADFSLSEDGKAQTLDRLDSETVPLQVALLLDTSDSMKESLGDTQEAAVTFVQSMKSDDRVTLIPFNANIRSIPQLTEDSGPILRAIRGTRAGYKTKLYDALLYAIKTLSGKEGRKAVVVFSDGEDTASSASLSLVLNAASRYGFPIFTVSMGPATRQQSFREILRQLADICNGKPFFVDNVRQLRSAFMEVASELRTAYVLYYYTLQSDERWHDLAVSVSNSRYKVYSRKGFSTGRIGSASNLAGFGGKGAEPVLFEGPEPEAVKENARAALDEVVSPPAVPRRLDADSPEGVAVAPGTKPRTATIKVDSHLVEVPVLVESLDGRDPPPFAERDFQVFEDGSRREIAYFAGAVRKEDLDRARGRAMEKAGPGTLPPGPGGGEDLILGRYYLVLDDLTSDVTSFLNAKKAAEEIIKKFHGALRPFSVYLTSRDFAAGTENTSTEAMLAEIRKAGPRSNRSLAADVINPYEATLIDRGDTEATEMGELRTAESMGLKWANRLGSVDGGCADATATIAVGRGGVMTCDPKANTQIIQATLQGKVAELLAVNGGYVRRNLDGLREVLNLAAADAGTYPKTIIFISPGFVTGKGSRADASSLLEAIASAARQRRIRIYAVDTGGSPSETPSTANEYGSLVTGPLMPVMNAHATAWQFEKTSPLDRLAQQSGGKRIKAGNDIAGSAGSAIAASGELYYMAFLSRQPTDGRFHKIGVFVSSRAVRLHARPGYYARPQKEAAPASLGLGEGEDMGALMKRADQAMKVLDYPELAAALQGLSRKLPNRPDIWFSLGVAHFNSKNPLAAVEAFQRALILSPEDRAAGLMLARAYAAAGNGEAAVEALQTLRGRNPLDLELLIQLGRVYEADSQPGKAYEVYRSALDITSALPLDFYLLLIRTSALLGRHQEADIFTQDYLKLGGAEARLPRH